MKIKLRNDYIFDFDTLINQESDEITIASNFN